jgi:mitotic spindle assembly checkpoint protein MAD1
MPLGCINCHRRRNATDSHAYVRAGEKLRRLEKEKGIVIRFVIGRSGTAAGGGPADRAIDAEEAEYKDFMRLEDHVEGYHELSSKTRIYFATAVATWDADFYVKVDDDVHVNLGTYVGRPPGLELDSRFMSGIRSFVNFLAHL